MDNVNVVISAIERDGLHNRSLNIELIAKGDMTTDDVLKAINSASLEYCLTEEGKKTYEGNCCCFNYGDFDTYVPNDICKKYGIEKVDSSATTAEVDFDSQLVNESDVFPEETEEIKNRYKLVLFKGEEDEQVVFAELTTKDVELILEDIYGLFQTEYSIKLENGDEINIGIIDEIYSLNPETQLLKTTNLRSTKSSLILGTDKINKFANRHWEFGEKNEFGKDSYLLYISEFNNGESVLKFVQDDEYDYNFVYSSGLLNIEHDTIVANSLEEAREIFELKVIDYIYSMN